MTQVWIYIVAASNNPDFVYCNVPWQVDKDLIFFGPCKNHMREKLRRQFLGPKVSHCDISKNVDSIYIVGFNGNNRQKIRKVIWAGRLAEVMTFTEASNRLIGIRFQELRADPKSPLHVRPIDDGKNIGYEHVSNEHITDNDWISDLVSSKNRHNIQIQGRKIFLRRGTTWEVFDRDCCLLLENFFFAMSQGIELNEEVVQILRQTQSKNSEINKYAIFGHTANSKVNGLRGTFLEISGDLAERFISWLAERSHKIEKCKQYYKDKFGSILVSKNTCRCR